MNLLFIYVGVVIAAGAGLLASFGPAEYPPSTLVATLAGAMLVVSVLQVASAARARQLYDLDGLCR